MRTITDSLHHHDGRHPPDSGNGDAKQTSALASTTAAIAPLTTLATPIDDDDVWFSLWKIIEEQVLSYNAVGLQWQPVHTKLLSSRPRVRITAMINFNECNYDDIMINIVQHFRQSNMDIDMVVPSWNFMQLSS